MTTAVQWTSAPAWPELARADVAPVLGGPQSQAWRVVVDDAIFLLRYTTEVGRPHYDGEVKVLRRLEGVGLERVPVVLRGPAFDPVSAGLDPAELGAGTARGPVTGASTLTASVDSWRESMRR